ncbi:MAG: succinate dehydrogenase iron-sulfur subunit [Planctomycetes bacterium]|nr:succinate dehydrogenase iron-sulfur subunit [Planctomycetota bacterium]
MPGETVTLKIKRQDSPSSSPYWETFSVPYFKNMNVISALQSVERDPKTASGKEVAPVVWDCNCLEEVCGACTMNINGRVRQSCSAQIDDPSVGRNITLEPMTKFPVIRDLFVQRNRLFKDLKKVKAWIPVDGTYDLGPGPRYSEKTQEWRYKLSECMSCGCCLEACPQYTKEGDFIGAAVVGQVVLFNSHPTGKLNAHERIEATMGRGGLGECGNSQNCVEVCPKHIPLTDAIAVLGRQQTVQMIKNLFGIRG